MLKWMKRCLHQVHGSAGTRSALKWLRTTPFSTRMRNPKLCHDSRHAGKEENASPFQEWQEHKEERPKPMAAADQCTICAIPEQKPSWAAHSHCLVAHGLSSAHGATQGTLLRQEQKQVVLEGRLWQWHLCNTAGQAANSTAKPQVREGNEAESGCESLTPVVPDLGALQRGCAAQFGQSPAELPLSQGSAAKPCAATPSPRGVMARGCTQLPWGISQRNDPLIPGLYEPESHLYTDLPPLTFHRANQGTSYFSSAGKPLAQILEYIIPIKNKQQNPTPPHLLKVFTLHILLASLDKHTRGKLRKLQTGKVNIAVVWLGFAQWLGSLPAWFLQCFNYLQLSDYINKLPVQTAC